MATINLQDVGVVSPRPLFQNLSLTIGPGDRIGLIAANGGGKSTLLRCIAGLTETGAGAVTLSRGLRLGLVEQDVPAALLDLTLAEAVRSALPPDRREHEGWRVGAVLDEFATPEELYDRPVRALSGGWQRLMLLARVWVTEPDALLLDEPTNHLDLEKIALLEAWIAGPAARTPLLVASHDRSFLDTSTTRTLFLRPGVSRMYAHPYSRARLLLADDDAAQDRKHTKDAKEAGRLRRNAGELRNVGVNSGSDLLQKKSMQLKERAEKLEQALRPAHVERTADIRLASRFGVDAQSRAIGLLSPGQTARLGLLALRLATPNLYLLDEPTNHVDIPGQEQLEAELLDQGATCILVSHDRSFVRAVGTRFLSIERWVAKETGGAG